MWKIPESIQFAAAFHHQPTLATSHQDETNIIYLANQLAHADTSSDDSIRESMSPDDPVWDGLDMPYGVIIPVCAEVKEQFSQTYQMFFGD
jgi:hypothetical protein